MIRMLNQETREQLIWMNEPPDWKFTDGDGIVIEAPIGADFFNDPAGKHIKATAPFLHTAVQDSFELTARLTVDMQKQYDSGCLMLMKDERNWCKLCFEYNGEAPTIVSVVTKDGISDDCNSEEVRVEQPYLRISKSANCVSFYYSEDGETWKLIRYFGMSIPGGGRAGIVAQSPHGNGSTVQFTEVRLTAPDQQSRF
ncbi:DUF1349 domain-containing protein [Paenibacillus albidus]|uniref:DUF1349 domain-containing protein n=1 Tax=Paenibacillus albidus TaxID=2041023 RepID=UPI001BE7AC39|nr:DUF1349 domain-containing protein [Paenibacillus albidus]MBT2292747.1 DUF1349 domain-containing protein [Paenibacillus albidus]